MRGRTFLIVETGCWQIERVRERGTDITEYTKAMSRVTAEIERILGVP